MLFVGLVCAGCAVQRPDTIPGSVELGESLPAAPEWAVTGTHHVVDGTVRADDPPSESVRPVVDVGIVEAVGLWGLFRALWQPVGWLFD